MRPKQLLILGGAGILLLLIVVAVLTGSGIVKVNQAKPIPETTYDSFTGGQVAQNGQPPIKGDPGSFYIVSDQLGNYFSGPQIGLLSSAVGNYVIFSVDKNVYRAKLSPNKVMVNGNTISFKLVLDKPGSGSYTVTATSDVTASTLTSIIITDPSGKATQMIQGG
jgi:hypothetical protein